MFYFFLIVNENPHKTKAKNEYTGRIIKIKLQPVLNKLSLFIHQPTIPVITEKIKITIPVVSKNFSSLFICKPSFSTIHSHIC